MWSQRLRIAVYSKAISFGPFLVEMGSPRPYQYKRRETTLCLHLHVHSNCPFLWQDELVSTVAADVFGEGVLFSPDKLDEFRYLRIATPVSES